MFRYWALLARLYLQLSDDRGITWSQAKQIDPSVPAHAEQFQQMIAVNKDGVVAVIWFDSVRSDAADGFRREHRPARTGSFSLRIKHGAPNDPVLGRMMILTSAAIP